MKLAAERVLSGVAALTLVACFALPTSLSFARHRHVQAKERRFACESFEAHKPFLTAQAGDTLWSLTERNTGKPWIWPQIWTFNPEMTNPHVVAVGQIVSFVPPGLGMAPRIQSHMPTAAGEAREFKAPASLDTPQVAQSEAGLHGEGDAALTSAPGPSAGSSQTQSQPASAATSSSLSPGATPPTSAEGEQQAHAEPEMAHLMAAALFSKEEWSQFGTVVASTQAGLLGGVGEVLQVRWPSSAPTSAGPYAVIRAPEGRPTADDGHASGHIGTCTGVATATPGKKNEAVVRSVREEIEVGQRVIPAAWLQAPSPQVQLARTLLCGRLVGHEHVAIAGNPLHVVFFNRGERDGLHVGDLLVGEGQGVGHAHRSWLRVLRVSSRQSTLAAVKATQELEHNQPLCTATKRQIQAVGDVAHLVTSK